MMVQLHAVPGFEELPTALLEEAHQLFTVSFPDPASGHLGDQLIEVYKLIDKVNREFVAKFATCRNGCSHCCRMDVQMTVLEAEYIGLVHGLPPAFEHGITGGHKTPCPFVSEAGQCAVYATRPLICRTYHALSEPALCGTPGAKVWQYGTVQGNMSNPVFLDAATWLHYQTAAIGGAVRDIRDWFPYPREKIQQHMEASRERQ